MKQKTPSVVESGINQFDVYGISIYRKEGALCNIPWMECMEPLDAIYIYASYCSRYNTTTRGMKEAGKVWMSEKERE